MTTTRSEDGAGADVAAEELRPAGRTATVRTAVALLLAAAAVAVVLDQWTKQLALDGLTNEPAKRILGGLIYLDLTFNKGAAFSFGTGYTFIFPVIAIVIGTAILWISRRLRSWPWAIALGLVLGGAMGNFVDRLFRAPGPFRGAVVDFISAFAPAGEKFPIFNIADSALTVGVVLAIGLELFGFRRDGTRVIARREAADGTP